MTDKLSGLQGAAAKLLIAVLVCGWPAVASAAPVTFRGLGVEGVYDVSADGTTLVGAAGRWTAATGRQDLGTLPGAAQVGGATAVSADGSVVVGTGIDAAGVGEAFRWTAATGKVGLGFPNGSTRSEATGVSADGSVVAGTVPGPRNKPFRWTAASGHVISDHLQATDGSSSAYDISDDGPTVVGNSSQDGFIQGQPVRWDPNGRLALASPNGGQALSASRDASVIVGTSDFGGLFSRPIIWRDGAATSFARVDTPAGPAAVRQGQAQAVSADGRVVVGYFRAGTHFEYADSFVWDELNGPRGLSGLLRDAGIDLTGWNLVSVPAQFPPLRGAIGISADGMTIVGNGLHGGVRRRGSPPSPGRGHWRRSCRVRRY